MADIHERPVSVPGSEFSNYDDSSCLRVNYLTTFRSFFVATRPSVFLYEGNKGRGLELEQVQSGKIT
jgi:hypothetical protein